MPERLVPYCNRRLDLLNMLQQVAIEVNEHVLQSYGRVNYRPLKTKGSRKKNAIKGPLKAK